MNAIRLTIFGKVVVAAALAVTFWAAINAVTPDECKVSAEDMSAACIALVYER